MITQRLPNILFVLFYLACVAGTWVRRVVSWNARGARSSHERKAPTTQAIFYQIEFVIQWLHLYKWEQNFLVLDF